MPLPSNTLTIAVLPGDGIGTEVTAATLAVLEPLAKRHAIGLRFEELRAGAFCYRDTGSAMSEETFQRAAAADAILLGAMGWPEIRSADGTELAPQLDLRFRLNLYAGVRPVRAIPGVPVALADPRAAGLDLVLIRESTEGLFFSRGRGTVTEQMAEETLRITRGTTERLARFSFRLAERRAAARGRPGKVTLVDKANVFRAFAFMRGVFDGMCAGRGSSTCCPPRTCSATSCPISAQASSAAWASRHRPISVTTTPCSSPRTAPHPTSPARGWPTRPRRFCRLR